MVFVTAYCCLVETARCSKGQSILIHAAAGAVGQAEIMLGQWLELDVFVTIGTRKKRNCLQKTYNIPDEDIFSSRTDSFANQILRATNNRGLDVALNSLSGVPLQATWRCMARFGHFIEIGKRDIARKSLLGMDVFDRNVSFSSVDLIQLGEFNPAMISRAFSQIMKLLESGQIKPVGPITKYTLADLERAVRLMQAGNHIGKIIIDAEPDTAQVTVTPGDARPVLSGMATYILVGGLGGLGTSILGAVALVGYVAATTGVAQRLARTKYRPLQEYEVLRCVDEAIRIPIRTPQTSQVTTGISTVSEDEISNIPGIVYRREPRFRGMLRSPIEAPLTCKDISKDSSAGGESLSSSLRETLQRKPEAAAAVQAIQAAIRHKIGEMFTIPAGEIEASGSLVKYGVDSLLWWSFGTSS